MQLDHTSLDDWWLHRNRKKFDWYNKDHTHVICEVNDMNNIWDLRVFLSTKWLIIVINKMCFFGYQRPYYLELMTGTLYLVNETTSAFSFLHLVWKSYHAITSILWAHNINTGKLHAQQILPKNNFQAKAAPRQHYITVMMYVSEFQNYCFKTGLGTHESIAVLQSK
jgi:hypothetical protein